MQVLVVEDERRMAELLRQGLEEEGHSVILAMDGKEGLAMAESHAFDAIVLDVMVPGLNLGADDYLVKPFSFDVLLARLRAVSRRGPIPQPVQLQVQDLMLNPASREV